MTKYICTEKMEIIKKNYLGKQIESDSSKAFVYLDFIGREELVRYQKEVDIFISERKSRVVDGTVGAAYEKFEAARMCKEDNLPESVRELSNILREKLGGREQDDFCAAAFCFPILGGMTSHRDYSFNRKMLGSLLVSGKVVFGVGEERDSAYENSVVLYPGDLMVLDAPERKDERPYFSVFCPEESILVRSWIRPREKCRFEGDEKDDKISLYRKNQG